MSTTAIILAQFKVAKAIYPHGLQVLLASYGNSIGDHTDP